MWEAGEGCRAKKQLLPGWLGGGEVYCGQRPRTRPKSGTSSPGHSLRLWSNGMGGSWGIMGGSKDGRLVVYLFPP